MKQNSLATAFRALLLKRCGECPFHDVELLDLVTMMLDSPIVHIAGGKSYKKVAPVLKEISVVIEAKHYTDFIQVLKHYNIDTTELEEANKTKYN